MDSLDRLVLGQVAARSGQGLACQLVAIVQTWGSSPRPAGAMMGICEDGRVVGSVSGGCIEDDLIARVRRGEWFSRLPEVITYGVASEDAHRFGLPCGGTIRLVCEPIGPGSGVHAVPARFRSFWHRSRPDEITMWSCAIRAKNTGAGQCPASRWCMRCQ